MKIIRLTLIVACGCLLPSSLSHAEEVTLTGASIELDDAFFTGCFHNAFEGLVVKQADGSLKSGEQGIQRTKGVLFGADTSYNRMTARFRPDKLPKGNVTLVLSGLDDHFVPVNQLKVTFNDREWKLPGTFNNNDVSGTKNPRYLVGWKELRATIPAEWWRDGENTLAIENTTSVLTSDHWNYAFIDLMRFEFGTEMSLRVTKPETPVYYYGLTEGVEVNLWPAINLHNRICLVTDSALEFNFFVTYPKEKPLGRETEPNPKRKITLHLLADPGIEITDLAGQPLAGSVEDGREHFTNSIERAVNFATPHPSQGVRLLLRARAPFEGKTLTAWCSVDGVDYPTRTFPVRAVKLDPLPTPTGDFRLSLWGGGIPSESTQRQEYVRLLKHAGFNRMFTGDDEGLNRTLKAEGFQVYPRFGWFGRKYDVTADKASLAAIDATGKPVKNDFCPLAILENADDPVLGRHFLTAKKMSTSPSIDGLCVDYETAAVWCWCDRCLALFEKETGIKASRGDLAPGGNHEADYQDFGRRRNRDLLSKLAAEMKAVNPALKYFSLASAADLPGYWWDGRSQGRHAAKELVKFADEIAASAYFYEVPGGLKSIRPIIGTLRQYALDAARSVNASVISPIATTVSESPRYRRVAMSPAHTRLLILLVATAQGRGVCLFRGDCFDGEHFLAVRQAVEDLRRLQPFLAKGLDRSFEVDVQPVGEMKRTIDLAIAEHLMARMVWHPDLSCQYDAVQYLKDDTAKERLLLLFNYSNVPMKLHAKLRGLADSVYVVSNERTSEKLGEFSRLALESGQPSFTVPPADCLFLRLVAADERTTNAE